MDLREDHRQEMGPADDVPNTTGGNTPTARVEYGQIATAHNDGKRVPRTGSVPRMRRHSAATRMITWNAPTPRPHRWRRSGGSTTARLSDRRRGEPQVRRQLAGLRPTTGPSRRLAWDVGRRAHVVGPRLPGLAPGRLDAPDRSGPRDRQEDRHRRRARPESSPTSSPSGPPGIANPAPRPVRRRADATSPVAAVFRWRWRPSSSAGSCPAAPTGTASCGTSSRYSSSGMPTWISPQRTAPRWSKGRTTSPARKASTITILSLRRVAPIGGDAVGWLGPGSTKAWSG